jgi:hypothetical protein
VGRERAANLPSIKRGAITLFGTLYSQNDIVYQRLREFSTIAESTVIAAVVSTAITAMFGRYSIKQAQYRGEPRRDRSSLRVEGILRSLIAC